MMKRITYQLVMTFLLAGLYLFPLGATAQSDTAWTRDKAAKWFASMEWYKASDAGQPKKKYDAFGRELEDTSGDTASKTIVNANLTPDLSANKLEFARQYQANPSRWDKAFAYLKNTDFSTLPPGRYPIDGTDVYAVITLGPGKLIDTTMWESHRNFEDIHYVISGKENLGIIPFSQAKVIVKYDSATDLAHYSAKGKYYVAKPGTFYIVTTEEAHRPGIKADGYDGLVKKLYIKIRKS